MKRKVLFWKTIPDWMDMDHWFESIELSKLNWACAQIWTYRNLHTFCFCCHPSSLQSITLNPNHLPIFCLLGFAPHHSCRNPTLRGVWRWNSHSQNWDLGVFRDSQNFRVRLQGAKTLRIGVFFISLKSRCRKWPHMGHLDIYSTSYGKKKGRESNWQFDSQPLKVGNRPDPDVCS